MSSEQRGMLRAVIEDNDNNWSGDHASNHPDVVPGILFSSAPLKPSPAESSRVTPCSRRRPKW